MAKADEQKQLERVQKQYLKMLEDTMRETVHTLKKEEKRKAIAEKNAAREAKSEMIKQKRMQDELMRLAKSAEI